MINPAISRSLSVIAALSYFLVLPGHAAETRQCNKIPTGPEAEAAFDSTRVKYLTGFKGRCRKAVFHSKNVTAGCMDHLWHAVYVHRATFAFYGKEEIVSFFGVDEETRTPDEYVLKLDGVIVLRNKDTCESTSKATGSCILLGDPYKQALIHCVARTTEGELFEGRFDTSRLDFMVNQLTGEVIKNGQFVDAVVESGEPVSPTRK